MGKSMEEILAEARRKALERMGLPQKNTDAPEAAERDYAVGESIMDTYGVLSEASRGGMGSVWRVRHKQWNIELAMKRPQTKYFRVQKDKDNFIRECEAWIELGLHPNIVSCYYVREVDGVPSIFSEWMSQGSLKDRIRDGSLYDDDEDTIEERLLVLAIQTARGLRYAHDHDLIHQDIKPDNVLLSLNDDDEYEAKIADFGLSKARSYLTVLEGTDTVREEETVMAPTGGYTLGYASPEQLDGRSLTRRSDIYSWAVTMMEMYLGKRHWQVGSAAGENCKRYFQESRIPVPEQLQELLSECMAKDSAARPHDFAEVEQRLLEIYREHEGRGYLYADSRLYHSNLTTTADELNNRALSYMDMKMPDKALDTWQRAMSADISNENVIFNYALARWRCGKSSLSDAMELLHFIPDEERVKTLTEVLRAESRGELRLNYPPDVETLPRAESCVFAPEAFRPVTEKKLRVSLLSPDGRLAVSADWDSVYITEKGERHGRIVRKLQTYEKYSTVYWVCFISDGDIVIGGDREKVFFWETASGRLISWEERSEKTDEYFERCIGSYWQNHFPGSYRYGTRADYLISRAENASERNRTEKAVEIFIERAAINYQSGDAYSALANLDVAAGYPGFRNAAEIIRLRRQYDRGVKRLGIRGLLFPDEECPAPERKSNPLPAESLQRKVMPALQKELDWLLTHTDNDVYSEYSGRIRPLLSSPDGELNLFEIVRTETRDSPCQCDIELTDEHYLRVFDAEGKLLSSKGYWWFRHEYTPEWEHRAIFSPDGRYLLYSGNGLRLIDLRTDREQSLSKTGEGEIGFTPDSRWAVHMMENKTLCIYETDRGALRYSRYFPAEMVSDMYILDNDSLALCIYGEYRCCAFEWFYDYPDDDDE